MTEFRYVFGVSIKLTLVYGPVVNISVVTDLSLISCLQ